MTPKNQQLLSPVEEAEALKNLLNDPDDEISHRLLQLHYQEIMDRSAQDTSGQEATCLHR